MGTIVDDCAVSTSNEEVWISFLQEIRVHVEFDAGPFTLFIGMEAKLVEINAKTDAVEAKPIGAVTKPIVVEKPVAAEVKHVAKVKPFDVKAKPDAFDKDEPKADSPQVGTKPGYPSALRLRQGGDEASPGAPRPARHDKIRDQRGRQEEAMRQQALSIAAQGS